VSEILGLLEVLKGKGGRDDIYKLAQELNMDFGDTLAVIRDAELLGFVTTPGGDVELIELGDQITREKINDRKRTIKAQIAALPVIQKVTDYLREQDEQEVARDEFLEKLVELIPNEDAEETFASVVNWGRYAELFGYNDDEQLFYLDSEVSSN
jgi:NitT/TauT family transport system ATP-binding protein